MSLEKTAQAVYNSYRMTDKATGKHDENQDLVGGFTLRWDPSFEQYSLNVASLEPSAEHADIQVHYVVDGMGGHFKKLKSREGLDGIADGFFARNDVVSNSWGNSRNEGEYLTGRSAALFIEDSLRRNSNIVGEGSNTISKWLKTVNDELYQANEAINSLDIVENMPSDPDNRSSTMIGGTIALVATYGDGKVVVGNLGDSRVGKLELKDGKYVGEELSQKHTVASYMLDDVNATSAGLRLDGNVTMNIGTSRQVEPAVKERKLEVGEYLILMSDGARKALMYQPEYEGIDDRQSITFGENLEVLTGELAVTNDNRIIYKVADEIFKKRILEMDEYANDNVSLVVVKRTDKPESAGLDVLRAGIRSREIVSDNEGLEYLASYRLLGEAGLTDMGVFRNLRTMVENGNKIFTLDKNRSFGEYLLSEGEAVKLSGMSFSVVEKLNKYAEDIFNAESVDVKRNLEMGAATLFSQRIDKLGKFFGIYIASRGENTGSPDDSRTQYNSSGYTGGATVDVDTNKPSKVVVEEATTDKFGRPESQKEKRLRDQKDALELEINEIETERDQLRDKVRLQNGITGRYEHLKLKYQRLRKDNERLAQEKARLVTGAREYKTRYGSENVRVVELSGIVERLEGENRELDRKYALRGEQIADYEREYPILVEAARQSKARLGEAKQSLETAISNSGRLSGENQALIAENASLTKRTSQYEQLRVEITRLRNQEAGYQRRLSEAAEKLSGVEELNSKIDELSRTIREKDIEYQRRIKADDDRVADYNALEERYHEAAARITTLEAQLRERSPESTAEIQRLTGDLNLAKVSLQTLRSEYDSRESDYERGIGQAFNRGKQDSLAEVERLTGELGSVTEAHQAILRRHQELDSNIATQVATAYESGRNETQAEIVRLAGLADDLVRQHKATIDELTSRYEEFERALDERRHEEYLALKESLGNRDMNWESVLNDFGIDSEDIKARLPKVE